MTAPLITALVAAAGGYAIWRSLLGIFGEVVARGDMTERDR